MPINVNTDVLEHRLTSAVILNVWQVVMDQGQMIAGLVSLFLFLLLSLLMVSVMCSLFRVTSQGCRNFYNDQVCESSCPRSTIYNRVTYKDEPNPDAKVSFGKICLEECPREYDNRWF